MPYDQQSIEYIPYRKVLSGLSPHEIEACEKSGLDNYFEYWCYEAYDLLCAELSQEKIVDVLNQMDVHDDLGDFLCDELYQKVECAAFLLILLDRFTKMAFENFDAWKGFSLMHQIYECNSYVSPARFPLRGNAKKAATARHAENHSMKNQAFEWYKDQGKSLKNDEAAIEIIRLVPISLRTAQDWVSSFRKILRSASKA